MTSPNSMFTEEQILKLLDEYFESGYTVPEYCFLQENIDEPTFHGWIMKYKPEAKVASVEKFVTVELIDDLSDPLNGLANKLFAEVGQIKLYRLVPASYLKSLTA